MALSLAEQKEAARLLEENFFAKVRLPRNAIVAAYWPVRGEINVLPLLLRLVEKGHPAALPQTVDRHTPLIFRAWKENTPMIKGAFAGLSEPDPAFADIVLPDVLLMPLLGFDAQGNRLGYGGGHYDRSIGILDSVRGNLLKIGVGYAFQQFDAIPAEKHDVRLDMMVTDRQVFNFGVKK